jgi:hypothetical protein
MSTNLELSMAVFNLETMTVQRTACELAGVGRSGGCFRLSVEHLVSGVKESGLWKPAREV